MATPGPGGAGGRGGGDPGLIVGDGSQALPSAARGEDIGQFDDDGAARQMSPPNLERRSVRVLAGVVIVVVVVVGLFAISTDGFGLAKGTDESTDESTGVGTTWEPAAGWQDFEPLTIPAEGGDIRMDPDVDYLLKAPEPITGPVELRGGRNVVWIGGEIRIDDTGRFSDPAERRALVIMDEDGREQDGRIVHLEGLLLHGDDLAEGINTVAPTAIIQLQNIRIDRVMIRGADDRDGTGGYPDSNHADVIQIWGGQKELRIDGLSGVTNYQGLFLREGVNHVGGPIWLRNVDIEVVETEGEDGFTYGGARPYAAYPGEVGTQYVDSGTVWIAHQRSSAFGSRFAEVAYRRGGRLIPDPVSGDATFADVLYPMPDVGQDELGRYATWPGPEETEPPVEILDWSGRSPARIYAGEPPAGDYVPADSVGIDYQRD